MSRTELARRIAATLLATAWNDTSLIEALRAYLGAIAPLSQQSLVRQILLTWQIAYPPSPTALSALVEGLPAFGRIARAIERRELVLPYVLAPPLFSPVARFAGLAIPQLTTAGDLAAWLGVPVTQLDWLADAKHRHVRACDTAMQHYRYRFIAKRSGCPRLLEAPKARLKQIQRRILDEILAAVPVHACAHGFVRGRSCVTGAARHASEALVLTVDLKDFFATIPPRRVHALFRALGYPWAVARLLTGLCTTATPSVLLESAPAGLDWQSRKLLAAPHLPQGAPTSPALANLCAWSLDRRLTGLADRFDAQYSRYADDLTFSGASPFSDQSETFLAAIGSIARDEGFALNQTKTRIMRAHTRQRVTGLVVNSHVNVAREDYDRLKATLHNCGRDGAATQNRDGRADFRAHLDGKVAWVESVNPARGAKLRRKFEAIIWDRG